jgi:probable F420-dependent oxidoreductase
MDIGVWTECVHSGIWPGALAEAVETRGFESLLFADHTHIPATPTTAELFTGVWGEGVIPPNAHMFDLFVAMTAAAAATTTLRVGSGVCLVVERDPIVTAKQVASIDVLSGGRVLFGVGVGWILEEIKNHGVNPSQRWAIQNERIQAMRAIWTSEQAEFHGEHVDFDPIYSWPKPLQRPHPPVLVGGAGRSVFKRVLAYGDEWMPEHGAPVEELAARIGELQTLASAAGRGRIPVTLFKRPTRTEPPATPPGRRRQPGRPARTIHRPRRRRAIPRQSRSAPPTRPAVTR